MSHTLTNYNGLQIVAPEADLSADRQALNDNFTFLADTCVRNPMTSNLDAGAYQITNLGGLSVNAVAVTRLDGGAISTDGYGDLTVSSTGSAPGSPPPFQVIAGGFTITIGTLNNGQPSLSATYTGGSSTPFLISGGIGLLDTADGNTPAFIILDDANLDFENFISASPFPTMAVSTGDLYYASENGKHYFQKATYTYGPGAGVGNGQVVAGGMTLQTSSSPSSGSTPGTTGQITWDSNNLYICTNGGSTGSATWKKVALTMT